MLEINNLHVNVGETQILKGLNLKINSGEVHAIMGPNGAGKSTLSYVLSGRAGYEVTEGTISYQGKNLLDMEPEKRAGEGIFLAFQYPVEIPGVSTMNFLKAAVNSVRKYRGDKEFDAMEFLKFVREQTKILNISDDMLKRAVNVGFSGGEKKRAEVLQMAVLDPILAVLDETDSGLDVDALRIVGEGVTALRSSKRSMLVITHYQRLLDYIIPDVVHVLSSGKIVDTGDKNLALELEKNGYEIYSEAVA
ncbi:MAG: Fe-S cluster assembly ATPase SufC [Rhodospirillaceae bacterium]|nr:Fe-S cluster assembly ATPase SufC [Rhodospirillaceae bacterium]OUT80655.1 MAG: Fe-S cluster assembly ATPase SufC [Rhodospirillaceae bacterium TMED23]|tara:strand:- start:6651 stop:7400 length:750 start_codon:yes stop_codon:yes gene_type:complete